MTLSPFALYADIGGTNARVAVQSTENSDFEHIKVYPSAHFNQPSEVILHYLNEQNLKTPQHITIAIACPITDDIMTMTNLHWSFSIRQTKKDIGIESLYFINDFKALVLSLPHLQAYDICKVGQGHACQNAPLTLIGPGTGVGVASLIHTGKEYIAVPSEGGHVLYPPQDPEEIEILKVVMQDHPVVSVEHLLSGSRGFRNLIKAVATVHGKQIPDWDGQTLFKEGLTHKNPLAIEILSRYCAMLGNVAGNLALNLGAHGGVYIGGGIVPRLGAFLTQSRFRDCFEKKDLAHAYIQTMPTFVITAEFPALIGAKYALLSILNNMKSTLS